MLLLRFSTVRALNASKSAISELLWPSLTH